MNKIRTLSFGNFIVFLTCIFLGSCVFDTDEIYQSPVNKDVLTPVITTIHLDFNTADTLFIYSPEQLNFSFSSTQQAIEAVSLTIDNGSPRVVNSNAGKFSFDNYLLPVGNHTVKLDVITKTGTGSIAEKVGAERFVSTKTWVLVNQKPNTDIGRVVENGFQKISWNSCRSNRLIDYVVYCDYKAIGIVTTNYFIDSTYVGDARRYEIKARLKDNETLEWGMLFLEDEMPVLSYSASKANVYAIRWSKPKYYNAVDTVKVFHHSNYNSRNVCIKSTTDVNDTTVIEDQSYFGQSVYFTVEFVPKKNKYPNDYSFSDRYSVGEYFLMGYKFIRSSNIFPIGKDTCIIDASDSILSYSISADKFTGKYLDDYGGDHVFVSAGGKYLVGAQSGPGNYFYALTNKLQAPYLVQIPDHRFGVYSNIEAISDNGLGIFIVDNWTINLFDLKTSKLITSYRDEQINQYDGIKFSSNGDYFFNAKNALSLYQIADNQIKLIQQTNEHRFYDFVSTNDQQYVTWNGSTLYLKQLPDHSIVRQLTLTDSNICNIDFYNNQVLTFSKGHFYVRSFLDGHIVYDLETKITAPIFSNDYYLQNQVLFNKWPGVTYYFNQGK